jgi:hypothetical protein
MKVDKIHKPITFTANNLEHCTEESANDEQDFQILHGFQLEGNVRCPTFCDGKNLW